MQWHRKNSTTGSSQHLSRSRAKDSSAPSPGLSLQEVSSSPRPQMEATTWTCNQRCPHVRSQQSCSHQMSKMRSRRWRICWLGLRRWTQRSELRHIKQSKGRSKRRRRKRKSGSRVRIQRVINSSLYISHTRSLHSLIWILRRDMLNTSARSFLTKRTVYRWSTGSWKTNWGLLRDSSCTSRRIMLLRSAKP